ncbi:MAG: response regulator [Elusimicrobia bacterium]|nr:response regulator [Candidatus Liberimonas magnetica]
MAKVLVIDDEQGMRQVTAKILLQKGHNVLQAEDGMSAKQIFENETLDLVLLDIRLPDMDGVEVLSEIKQIKPDLPVIMLSGFGDVETAVELVRQGAFDYVSKPYKVDKLLSLVENALGQGNTTGSGGKTDVEKNTQQKPAADKISIKQDIKKTAIKPPLLFAVMAAFILLSGGFFSFKFLFNRPVPEKEFSIPYSNPSAICFYGENLWVSDLMEESIYKHSMDDKLSIIVAYKLAGIQVNGIACDGNYLWTCNSFDQKIRKHKLDYNLSVVSTYNATGLSISGIYFDGTSLWSIDFQQGKINKHKIDDLSIVNTYRSPAANPCGMFKKGGSFYVVDAGSNRIYKVKGSNFSLEAVYTLDKFKNSRYHITAMAFDGKSIWLCASGIQTIFRCPLTSLKPAD